MNNFLKVLSAGVMCVALVSNVYAKGGSSPSVSRVSPPMVFRPAPVAQVRTVTSPQIQKTTPVAAPRIASAGNSDEERRKREAARRSEEVVQHNTIIQHNYVEHTQPASSGGGWFMPAAIGGLVGYFAGHHNSQPEAPVAQQPQYPVCPDPIPVGWNTPCIPAQTVSHTNQPSVSAQ